MEPTLLILAAGLGSRYGGLKQLDGFGPSGETIMDYSIHDALSAGFTRVVFVIRRDFESTFRASVGSKYERWLSVDYVFQELDELPGGVTVPSGRTKPWGTTHAIWCARHTVKGPFVSINADDYYGRHSFTTVAQHLRHDRTDPLPDYCVVGYPLMQTLSDHGTVARAICEVDENGKLKALVERLRIERCGDSVQYLDESGHTHLLKGDEVVSMNMVGFTPAVFSQVERQLVRFLTHPSPTPDGSELPIPVAINEILKEKAAIMRVLPTTDTWFGVTHAKDKPAAMTAIREMVKRGDYPSPIWGER